MATSRTRPKSSRFPLKIALALGSGVAKGWAHIGVIRALHKAGYEPDIIAGTSIGAVAGGCYAAGKLDELEEFALSLTRFRMIRLLDFRLGGSGLFAGGKLAKILEQRLGQVKIENLPRMFIAVTTELATGHELWIREGSLVPALRASYALPGVFSPVHLERRWLIDGALVNPVPSSVCRAFGGRLVIAVNLNQDAFGQSAASKADTEALAKGGGHTPLSPRRILMRQIFGTSGSAPGLTSVMLAALNIVQDRLARSRLAGDPPDVLITPRVGHIGLLEFDRAKESIKLGEEAAKAALPHIAEAAAILS